MNEKFIFEGICINFPSEKFFHDYVKIPELNTVEDLLKQEATSPCKLRFYSIPSEVFNEFLSVRFGFDIAGFRRLYSSKHSRTLRIEPEELFYLGMYVHPIPQRISAYFEEVNTSRELAFKLEQCEKVIQTHSSTGPLNLHNHDVCNFTLIRAKFNLEEIKEQWFFGYYFSTTKFRFIIKSSNQFDITVTYEEL